MLHKTPPHHIPPPAALKSPAAARFNSAAALPNPAAGHFYPAAALKNPAAGRFHSTAALQNPAAGRFYSAAALQTSAAGRFYPAAALENPAAGRFYPAAALKNPAAGHFYPAAAAPKLLDDRLSYVPPTVYVAHPNPLPFWQPPGPKLSLKIDPTARFRHILDPSTSHLAACLQDLAEFAARPLHGNSIPDVLPAVGHHISARAECDDEYLLLRTYEDASRTIAARTDLGFFLQNLLSGLRFLIVVCCVGLGTSFTIGTVGTVLMQLTSGLICLVFLSYSIMFVVFGCVLAILTIRLLHIHDRIDDKFRSIWEKPLDGHVVRSRPKDNANNQ